MVNYAQNNVINKFKSKKMNQKNVFPISILFSCIITSCNNKVVEHPTTKRETADTAKAEKVDYSKQGFGNILIDSQTTYKYKGIFEGNIRKIPLGIVNDKISQSVWFSRQAILLLADSLRKYGTLDGVRIHLIAYDTLKSAPGQYKSHQVSLVMVPTNPKPDDANKHIDNWQVLKNETEKAGFFKGLNHGELCPKICNY
jgi:hypothetical protein